MPKKSAKKKNEAPAGGTPEKDRVEPKLRQRLAGSSRTGGATEKKRPTESAGSSSTLTQEEDGEEEESDDRTKQPPHIPGFVVRKLVGFSLLLLIAPIFVYFASLKYAFVGSTAASAITAVVAANLVLASWVYAAWAEGE
ncbi:hypothetical protein LPJ72_001974 [Coemansia sp. Benny D160-2]|nr:hypothetical protein LPJ72_001974 [Coemansia sp. Benny D160-2]